MYTFRDSLVHAQRLTESLNFPENQACLQPVGSSLPGCLYDLLSAGEEGNAQQSAGTSQHCRDCQPFLKGNHTSFSQITEALDGPFPAFSGNEKMKRGDKVVKARDKKGQKLKREVAKPRHVTYTISGISE